MGGILERGSLAPGARAISGTTRLFAIVGDPIVQVRSPERFNAHFVAYGVDAVLVPMRVTAAELDEVLTGLRQVRNIDGIVVTVPHKVAAVRHADWLLPTAESVGAVNALARQADGRWAGEMFDGHGFVTGLANAGYVATGSTICLIGAGGVGRAIAFALAAAGVAAISVRDIEQDRAMALVLLLAHRYPKLRVGLLVTDPSACDLAINATPLGMQPEDRLPFALTHLPPEAWVAEVVMKPDVTRLVAEARARGHRVLLGGAVLDNEMLAIARFFGVSG